MGWCVSPFVQSVSCKSDCRLVVNQSIKDVSYIYREQDQQENVNGDFVKLIFSKIMYSNLSNSDFIFKKSTDSFKGELAI